MSDRISPVVLATTFLMAGCATAPNTGADPDIAAEVRGIRAIDNHAHPVRVVAPGEAQDRGFDALPVDNMEPQTDPVNLRAGVPAMVDAWNALYGLHLLDLSKPRLGNAEAAKEKLMAAKGNAYPEWVLDQMGEETMLANRVEMGPSIQPPRFRWVPYADALIFPLDNSKLAARNPDRKAFFALEDDLRARYLKRNGLQQPPGTLAEYLARVVTPTLEAHRRGGAVAEKFEAAYLRSLAFDKVDRTAADRVYAKFIGKLAAEETEYKPLQDFLFRYVAAECGRLGMAVHIHAMAGAGGYFEVSGANPLLLESVLNDPELRKTRFVMLHGGWPFIREIAALLTKPNAYLDFSQQDLMLPPSAMASNIREWLEIAPEKVLFATDAYPYIPEMGWEESGWMAARTARDALSLALTGMMRDGEITRRRASELARMVLRDNARALYGL
jgi:predicted TIM-barrel fold metal-dependent hydrolase